MSQFIKIRNFIIILFMYLVANQAAAQGIPESNQITPSLMDSRLRTYVETEYVANGGMFVYIKGAADQSHKYRFNRTFIEQFKSLANNQFVLPSEFIDEQENPCIVDVFFLGTNRDELQISQLVLRKQ